jgi:transposase
VPDYVQTWKRKLRLKELADIAQNELKSGKEMEKIFEQLDEEMKSRWNLVLTTRKQYLRDIHKILTNQYVLVMGKI